MMPKEDDTNELTLKDHTKVSNTNTNTNQIEEEDKHRDPNELAEKFPALAIPDKLNKEELELDLGLETEPTTQAKEIKPQPRRERSKSRSRSKSKSRDRDRHHKKKKKRRSSSRSSRRSSASSRSRSASSTRRNRDKRRKEKRREKEKEAEVGKIYDGVVTNCLEYGCFVSLDGFRRKTEGLVHVSQMSKNRVKSARDFVQKGQKVLVKVTSINGGKISLSMK